MLRSYSATRSKSRPRSKSKHPSKIKMKHPSKAPTDVIALKTTAYFAKRMELEDISLFYATDLSYEWKSLREGLLDLLKNGTLLGVRYKSGRISSGFPWPRISGMMYSLPGFGGMLLKIEQKFHIETGWVAYFGKGVNEHNWHCDGGYGGSHRVIISLGGDRKMMHFRPKQKPKSDESDDSDEMSMRIPHCAAVMLSRKGGGVSSTIQHKVDNCENSWSLVLEVTRIRVASI